jgi:IclR family pca regulon transcriptional regulator
MAGKRQSTTEKSPASLPESSVAEPSRPEYRVEALAKGLRVLSLFTEQRPTWRVSDIAPAVGMPLPTVYRVIMTLSAEGYLEHLANGDYRPGARVLTLGNAALRSMDLVELATPRLQSLAAACGETVNLAVLTGDRVLYLVRLRNSDLVTANIQVGSTLPAVHTSIGKLLLAYLDEQQLDSQITGSSFAARDGPCRTKNSPSDCARSPRPCTTPAAGSSPVRTLRCSRGTGPPSASSASSNR